MEDQDKTVDLAVARHRAASVALLKDNDLMAVKVPHGQKSPGKDHPRNNTPEKAKRTLNEIEFSNDNIGVHLHSDIVDVDVDVKDNPALLSAMTEALDRLLPRSPHVWGTAKRARTHRLYRVKDVGGYDPAEWKVLLNMFKYPEGKVEVLGGVMTRGAFSMLPGSLHPNDGYYQWAKGSEPDLDLVAVTMKELVRSIRLAATCVLVSQYWVEGQRQDMAMAFAGMLHRMAHIYEITGDDVNDAFLITMEDATVMLELVMDLAGDDHKDKFMRRKAFEKTWQKAEAGLAVTGATRLQELSGREDLSKILYVLLCDNPSMQEYQQFEDDWAVHAVTGEVVNLKSIRDRRVDKIMVSRQQFVNAQAHMRLPVNGKLRDMSDMLYRSKTTRRVTDVTFNPARKEAVYMGDDGYVVNTWTGFDIEPDTDVTDEDVDMFIDYIENVLCSGDKDLAHWVYCWLGDILKNPGNKPGTCLVLVGDQGTGKSFLGEGILGKIIGENHYIIPDDPMRFFNKFNTLFGHKVLIQLEEVMNANQRGMAERMKAQITGTKIVIEDKGVTAITLPALHRLLLTSNHIDNSVALDDGVNDRRYTIVKTSNLRRGDVAYWRSFVKWLTIDKLAQVHGWLVNYKIDATLIRKSYLTKAKTDTSISSMNVFDRWLMWMMDSGHPLHADDHKSPHHTRNTDHPEDGQVIVRDRWPEYVSLEVMHKGFERINKSVNNNLRQMFSAAALRKKLVEHELMGSDSIRPRIQMYDERTGERSDLRVRFYGAPDRVAVHAYLCERYGKDTVEDQIGTIDDILKIVDDGDNGDSGDTGVDY